MSAPVVLIIGCGIAGPVLAILLQRKGYKPIVFERVSRLGDAGASLMLMSNGLKVLDLVGLAEKALAESIPIQEFHDASASGAVLGTSALPSTFAAKYGQPIAGVRRTALNLMLKDLLVQSGVDVREGWELQGVREDGDSVTARFDGGREVRGSFLVGCDGIKSAARRGLLGLAGVVEGAPAYTGLTQTAGISPTPPSLQQTASMRNWYGAGTHLIAYPISKTHTSWAVTRREAQETAETWRPCRADELPDQRRRLGELLRGWDAAAGELVGGAERIIKFGLFDRGELRPEQWFSARCVLVGDAAHPTSPHLGQGANQALEDCFHLSNALPDLLAATASGDAAATTTTTTTTTSAATTTASPGTIGANLSETVFRPYAEKRQPRTSALVRGARAQGEQRVLVGEEACRERDALIARSFAAPSVLADKFEGLLREPF